VVDEEAFLDLAALLGDAGFYPVNVVADIDAIGDGALVVVFGDAVLVEIGDGLRRGGGGEADEEGVKVFEDRASGDGDVLIVWKLDRLGRSLPHLIETVSALEKRAVGFHSLTEAIDTTTPGGRLVFHLFGALGQFERDLIRERTRAGLAAAEARGRKGGRKPVITAEKLERAQVIIGKGLTVREAATRLRVGKTALYEALRG
jgi:DNA invertase Pin-like site-specific DNA recombinase